jgi:hypothetical protein
MLTDQPALTRVDAGSCMPLASFRCIHSLPDAGYAGIKAIKQMMLHDRRSTGDSGSCHGTCSRSQDRSSGEKHADADAALRQLPCSTCHQSAFRCGQSTCLLHTRRSRRGPARSTSKSWWSASVAWARPHCCKTCWHPMAVPASSSRYMSC